MKSFLQMKTNQNALFLVHAVFSSFLEKRPDQAMDPRSFLKVAMFALNDVEAINVEPRQFVDFFSLQDRHARGGNL